MSRVADNAVRFWYRFVHPNRSRLETGDVERVWTAEVSPNLGTYMGRRALSAKGYHLYVSAAGFTEHFHRRAAEHGRIRLVALEDLY